MSSLGALLLANIPLLILMLVGIVLLVVEMYIPGFGVPGILGLASLVLSFFLLRPTVEQGLVLLAVLAAILCVALSICLITASKGREANLASRVIRESMAPGLLVSKSRTGMRIIFRHSFLLTPVTSSTRARSEKTHRKMRMY